MRKTSEEIQRQTILIFFMGQNWTNIFNIEYYVYLFYFSLNVNSELHTALWPRDLSRVRLHGFK